LSQYKSKKDAENKLKAARKSLKSKRDIWLKNKSDANKKAMDDALKLCVDIQFVIDRYF
jgi:hypothetical protein